jgi:hypothetical protein
MITAVTGLIVALNHVGSRTEQRVTPSSQSVPDGAPGRSPAESRSPGASGGDAQPVALPALNRVRLAGGNAVVTILSAQVEPIDAERRSLKVHLRHTNAGRYPANFWSDSYRLIVNDVPRAPTNLLDEVVDGDSAKEGDVVFDVPVSVKDVVLQISAGDEKSRVPLTLP